MSPIVRLPFALSVSLGTVALLLAGCHRSPSRQSADAGADADAGFDAGLPETETVYLDAGIETDGRRAPREEDHVPPMLLPRPCTDKALGSITFVQDGAKVKIASSKAIASATCVRMDEHKLLCDWVDKDGKPTVSRRPVSYGPKTKIAGTYDGKHSFSCPAQADPTPAPAPKPPSGRRKAGPR